MKFTYKHTMKASFVGYIVQAIVNNFAPLLFLTFQKTYEIPLSKITFLITFNFGLQLTVDVISALLSDKINTRVAIVAANVCASVGLCLLAILPEVLPDPFIGLLLAVTVYAVGGGLLEVLVSPIVEACPNDNKEGTMSLLHSFYCWGHVGVVLLSTLFFATIGIEHWKILAVLFALVPALNAVLFTQVPLASLLSEGETALSLKELFSNGIFWIFLLIMIGSGGSELAVSQWVSALAEKGLAVEKTVGDLLGTMMFAIMMGLARVCYSRFGEKMPLAKTMFASAVLCCISYLLIALSLLPVLGLVGCGLCGFSVGLFWPGTFSLASARIRRGGTAMFAILALGGDLGCSSGPTVVGLFSGLFGENLRLGVLAAGIFPVMILIGLMLLGRKNATKEGQGKQEE